jgi:multidrug efflux pump
MDTDFTELSARISRLENGPPVGFPVQFRVLGKDPQQIRQIAEQVREVVRANPHTRDVNFDWHEMSKSVEMDIDRARARALGLAPSDVAKTMDTFLNGVTIGEVRERNDLIPVVARAIPEERRAIDDIGSASIFVSDPVTGVKKTLSLDQVANLKPTFEEPVLWRRNRDTMMVVRAEVGDATQPPVVSQQIDKALSEIRSKLPDGYRVEMAGAIEESAKSNVAIGAVVPVMILAMLAILMVQLQSFSRLALVLATAPLGLIGVTISLLLFRQPFGFVALLGVIALAGMIMRNSVILVDQIDQGVAAGEPPLQAIVNATIHRARPVVLTAAAAILAMIPLARTDFWGPMAVAIMGGLAVATVLTLIVLPALYARWLAKPVAPALAVVAKAAE